MKAAAKYFMIFFFFFFFPASEKDISVKRVDIRRATTAKVSSCCLVYDEVMVMLMMKSIEE